MKWVLSRIKGGLFASHDAASLGIYRIAFALIMLAEWYRIWSDFQVVYLEHAFHAPLDFWGWVRPFSPDLQRVELVIMLVSCLLLMVGRFPRLAAAALFLIYGHFMFGEKQLYNNHYYLIWMDCGFLTIINSDGRLAWGKKPQRIPGWQIWLLRLQLMLVYIYGGLVKLNPDWFSGLPMILDLQTKLQESPDYYWLAVPVGLALSYAGIIFDLLIGFALLYRPTRVPAIPFLLIFHITNYFYFGDIGIFPWYCLASTILFFPPENVARFVDRRVSRAVATTTYEEESAAKIESFPVNRVVVGFLVVHFLVQILLPLRHHLVEGNYRWTFEQYFFAWTMKLGRKDTAYAFEVYDPVTKKSLISPSQQDLIAPLNDPIIIWDYCKFLENRARKNGMQDPEVYVFSVVSLNGRPHGLFVDPNIPINKAKRPNFTHATWLMPMVEWPKGYEILPEPKRKEIANRAVIGMILEREKTRRLAGIDTSGFFAQ